jgi:DNA gyrase/topoisomerase IV subunit B
MRKALIPWLLSSALVAVPVASAQAQTSIACMYMLMRVYKAEMDYCKVPLAPDRDARYERLKTGLENFIRSNAKQDPDKIFSNIENSNIKRALAGLKSCNSDDFKYAQQAMDKLTTPDNEKMVQSSLTIKRDPMTGDCSS